MHTLKSIKKLRIEYTRRKNTLEIETLGMIYLGTAKFDVTPRTTQRHFKQITTILDQLQAHLEKAEGNDEIYRVLEEHLVGELNTWQEYEHRCMTDMMAIKSKIVNIGTLAPRALACFARAKMFNHELHENKKPKKAVISLILKIRAIQQQLDYVYSRENQYDEIPKLRLRILKLAEGIQQLNSEMDIQLAGVNQKDLNRLSVIKNKMQAERNEKLTTRNTLLTNLASYKTATEEGDIRINALKTAYHLREKVKNELRNTKFKSIKTQLSENEATLALRQEIDNAGIYVFNQYCVLTSPLAQQLMQRADEVYGIMGLKDADLVITDIQNCEFDYRLDWPGYERVGFEKQAEEKYTQPSVKQASYISNASSTSKSHLTSLSMFEEKKLDEVDNNEETATNFWEIQEQAFYEKIKRKAHPIT